MKKSEKILIFTIVFLIVFSIGTAIVVRTIDEFKSNESDLTPFIIVVFARLFTLIGFLTIIAALFLRGSFKNIEKAKFDILDLEEKIEKAEKEKRGKAP